MTTEMWKPIPGYEGEYEVSDLGRVRSLPRITITRNGRRFPISGGLLREYAQKRGYLTVSLAKDRRTKPRLIHQLVAAAFIGPRLDGFFVAHWNGDKHDNRLANLRYATRKENAADAVRLNEVCRGERNAACKLTAAIVREIREADGSQEAIARRYGVSQSLVSLIRRKEVWRHVA